MSEENQNSQNNTTQEEGATPALIGYIFLLGWLIAYFGMHTSKPSKLGAFHLRQALIVHLVFLILPYAAYYLPFGGWIGNFSYLLYLVFVVMGLTSAQRKELKPLPLFGEIAQNSFQFIKEE